MKQKKSPAGVWTPAGLSTGIVTRGGPFRTACEFQPRVVKKLGRALGASLVWSENTPTRQVVPGSSDLLRPIEGRANS